MIIAYVFAVYVLSWLIIIGYREYYKDVDILSSIGDTPDGQFCACLFGPLLASIFLIIEILRFLFIPFMGLYKIANALKGS